MSPEKLTECMVGTRQALGYDGLCAGAYGGIAAMMGGHLPNSEGKIVGDGDDVIHSFEDIEKLKPYDPSKCMMMKNVLRTIELNAGGGAGGADLCHTPCSGGGGIYIDGGEACV